MFTGIIEGIGTVRRIQHDKDNIIFTLTCPFVSELKPAQSLAHNGVCLTITGITGDQYTVLAMHETLRLTNLGLLKEGDEVNLERCMPANGRFDGHIVQGHVDTTALCTGIRDENGSYAYTFQYDVDPQLVKHGYFCADKGSVTVNGVSLTVCNPTRNSFEVNIIPFTYEHTNFHVIHEGSVVNIEFDILGKLIARLTELKG